MGPPRSVRLRDSDILEIRQLTGSDDLPPEILQLIREAAPTWSTSQWRRER